jgi:hypothetical protein
VFGRQFEIMAEHNDWTPPEKSAHLIAALNMLAVHILCGLPTGATYKEVTEALENRYGDHHLEAVFHLQLKRTQLVGESLQMLASSIDHLAHSAPVELPEHLICIEATHAFADAIRKRDIR